MKIISIILLSIFGLLNAQTADQYVACNGVKTFTSTTQTYYVYWQPTKGDATTCTYLVKSPINTFISATIYHNLTGSEPSCSSGQRAWVSRDGDYEFDGASYFCGNRMSSPLQINSIGNEFSVAVQSSTATGAFQVIFKVIQITQSNCDCSWNVNTRIIGGTNASPNEFTMHAAFKTNYANQFNEAVCGGTILTQNWIVSAAHCIYAFQNEYNWNILAHVGRHNITAAITSDTIYSASYGIGSVIVHNGYNSENNANDIGLVKTATYMKFNRGVGPVCLPYAYKTYNLNNGNSLTAVGFGSTAYAFSAGADKKSWILQKVSLTVDNTLGACSSDANRVCVKGTYDAATQQAKDTCQRDSGGSLYGYMNSRAYCFGIISEGYACGAQNSFSTNTYVPKYIDWIQNNIQNDFFCQK